MTNFSVEDGRVTLSFDISDIVRYGDTMNRPDLYNHHCDLDHFARMVTHLTERKPNNCTMKYDKVLKSMGLHRYKVASSNWKPLLVYAPDKESAQCQVKHLKGVRITEDKKWYEEAE